MHIATLFPCFSLKQHIQTHIVCCSSLRFCVQFPLFLDFITVSPFVLVKWPWDTYIIIYNHIYICLNGVTIQRLLKERDIEDSVIVEAAGWINTGWENGGLIFKKQRGNMMVKRTTLGESWGLTNKISGLCQFYCFNVLPAGQLGGSIAGCPRLAMDLFSN